MSMETNLDLPFSVKTQTLAPALGVEISGINLDAPISLDHIEALRTLYHRYHLLLIKAPSLTGDAQARFADIFGVTSLRERNKKKVESNDNQFVSNVRADGIFGKGELDYHIDQLFLEEPLKALILYAVEMPEHGGDTIFVNAEAAYESMPEGLKRRIDGLRCLHARAYDTKTTDDWNVVESSKDSPSWIHPMVHTDLNTGKRALWVNKITTLGVDGMAPEESDALINEVRDYLYDPALAYCHSWTPGDLILWNNLVLQHARAPFAPTARRTLRRTAIL